MGLAERISILIGFKWTFALALRVLPREGWVGAFTSLALDDSGYAHISYYDVTDHDLKYAYAVPWLNLCDPGRPLLLPASGATVYIVYRNMPTPATLPPP